MLTQRLNVNGSKVSSPGMTWPHSLVQSLGSSNVASTMALLALCACSSVPPVKVDSAPIDLPNVLADVLPNPEPIRTLPLEWRVLTPETMPEGDQWVFFALTPPDYENLARNQAETLRWVKEAMWRLEHYRKQAEARNAQ